MKLLYLIFMVTILQCVAYSQLVVQKARVRTICNTKNAAIVPIQGVRVQVETEERSDNLGIVHLKISSSNDGTYLIRNIWKEGYILIDPSINELNSKKYALNKNCLQDIILADINEIQKMQEIIMQNSLNTYYKRREELAMNIQTENNIESKIAMQEELDLLRSQENRIWHLIDNQAAELARTDYLLLSEDDVRVLELKKEGRIDELITILLSALPADHAEESKKIGKRIELNEQKLCKLNNLCRYKSKNYKELALAHTKNNEFILASHYHRYVLILNPTDRELFAKYEVFLHTHFTSPILLIREWQKGLDLALLTFGRNHQLVADFYHSIGNCYYKYREFEKAKEYFQISESLYKNLRISPLYKYTLR